MTIATANPANIIQPTASAESSGPPEPDHSGFLATTTAQMSTKADQPLGKLSALAAKRPLL